MSTREPGLPKVGGGATACPRLDWSTLDLAANRLGRPVRSIVLAVSGGGDSMAMMHLAARASIPHAPRLHVCTVDHGLRAGATADVRAVLAAAEALGLGAQALTWTGDKPRAGLMAAARAARAALLARAARALGADMVLLAHTQEDQAETVAMRLDAGSGPHGAAGMAPASLYEGCVFARPCLGMARADLRAWLTAQGLSWREDPSNEDERYARVRMRRALSVDPARVTTLNATAAEAGARRAALQAEAGGLLSAAARVHPTGLVRLDRAALALAAEPVRRAAVAAALRLAGPGTPHTDVVALGRLSEALAGPAVFSATLGGVRILARADATHLVRERRRLPDALDPLAWDHDQGERRLWDGRFVINRGRLGPGGLIGPGPRRRRAPRDPDAPAFLLQAALAAAPWRLGASGAPEAPAEARFTPRAGWRFTPSWDWPVLDGLGPDPAPLADWFAASKPC